MPDSSTLPLLAFLVEVSMFKVSLFLSPCEVEPLQIIGSRFSGFRRSIRLLSPDPVS